MTVADQRALPAPAALPTPATEGGGGGLFELVAALWKAAERHAPTASIRDTERHYRQLLEAIDVAIYTTDADGRITFYNDAAATFWGRRPEIGEEWCGSFRLLYPDGSPMRHDECPMAVALHEGREVRGGQAIAERPDGSNVHFLAHPTPLRDADGTIVGAVNVLVDVTERVTAEAALRAAADSLRTSNAVKDEFLGLVSHELRTPVTTIFGNARLLQDRGDSLPEEYRRSMVADIAADSERLLGIVENLLLLTRLETGPNLDLEPQVLGHVVRNTVDTVRQKHPGRDIVLRMGEGGGIVDADRTYIEILLTNLLSNALKYSAPSTTIEVEVTFADDEAQVAVLDRGIGVHPDDLPRLFDPFYRADAAKAAANGIGVGLAVCRRVVEIQGGRIWVTPRDGGGTIVAFALPHRIVSEDAD